MQLIVIFSIDEVDFGLIVIFSIDEVDFGFSF
jgi:hypothetical protein